MWTVHTLFTHCSYTVHTLFTHCSHTVHTLFTHCSHTVHTLFTHCSYTVHTLFTHCSHTVHTLFIHCSYTVHTLFIHCSHTVHTLFTHYLPSITFYHLSQHWKEKEVVNTGPYVTVHTLRKSYRTCIEISTLYTSFRIRYFFFSLSGELDSELSPSAERGTSIYNRSLLCLQFTFFLVA
jgi:hypothetical protein